MARFGFAKDIITPPFKTPVACTGDPDPFRTVHDDCFVRACLIDDGTEKALVMAFDLLFHSPDLFDDVRAMAAPYGIKPEHVVVGCTHSHNAPASAGYNAFDPDEAYEAFLRARAADCLARAEASLFEGTLEAGVARGDWSVSRRLPKDGKMKFAPNPDGVADDRLDVLAVRDASGRLRGIVAGYGCHPVHYCDRTGISAEYPGRLALRRDRGVRPEHRRQRAAEVLQQEGRLPALLLGGARRHGGLDGARGGPAAGRTG
jgi:hypothetical protein